MDLGTQATGCRGPKLHFLAICHLKSPQKPNFACVWVCPLPSGHSGPGPEFGSLTRQSLAVEQLDLSSFTFTEGDVVYVHWHARGEFPAGWYRAVLVHN